MRVLFRVDSGLHIGTGHVMRCLTLANALQARGVETIFLTRTHTGHVVSALAVAGHRVETMLGNTGQPYGAHPAPPAHAAWLEADWRSDAAQTRATLQKTGAEWLVVDHYALDQAWQEAAMPEHVRLLVIDDLADRPHQASVLLDQNFGRISADYAGLVPAGCELRIGPANALLRPEFARLRPAALVRRDAMVRPERLLITLGGIDLYNATSRVLDVLAVSPHAIGLKITVVLGENAPHLAAVQTKASNMPMHTEVAVNVADMANRMVMADLCIGAAGSTAWERCALGLPTLQVVLADNQISAARHMADDGLTIALPFTDSPGFAEALDSGLEVLGARTAFKNMAHAAAALTDGRGAERLASDLLERTSNDAD
ncbi:UDP-2,4-diacetamido-2,4,6-trideoxy-beta-L-altropyranose hydrolase [Rhodovulum sulfidophilum]|uniref:UDP-2,4-diacetamido-2,4, 6-trideoxy-beta-L-altropyranose hydrolase n=1 Tax=Rhodovulum sulfidophilum TaxID=35806 RepID=UPI0019216BB6|nr:UDP-2,4-diacetamido-2,4,6-trideoxy-beta-L-altropyranose hydrolase [Rhodovulum sulfidophilum]MBL3560628.1 UDP-2,4-diacetamido-2,4,6-trideoxy-beta-L-altropyranose hydrolase [Rhodovulum sulfidophilum]